MRKSDDTKTMCIEDIRNPKIDPPSTQEPTDAPTDGPTTSPTNSPTDEPTILPTNSPTDEPTIPPTDDILSLKVPCTATFHEL